MTYSLSFPCASSTLSWEYSLIHNSDRVSSTVYNSSIFPICPQEKVTNPYWGPLYSDPCLSTDSTSSKIVPLSSFSSSSPSPPMLLQTSLPVAHNSAFVHWVSFACKRHNYILGPTSCVIFLMIIAHCPPSEHLA